MCHWMCERITPQSFANEKHIKVAAEVASLRQHFTSRMYFPKYCWNWYRNRGKLVVKNIELFLEKIYKFYYEKFP